MSFVVSESKQMLKNQKYWKYVKGTQNQVKELPTATAEINYIKQQRQ